jgi:hypothetical protein
MTLARSFAISVAVSCGVVSGAIGCSSAKTSPDDAGSDARIDAGRDTGSKDVATKRDAADSAVDAGPPFLTELRVAASDASPPIALVPPFSSSIHDYYVRCIAGPNTLAVTMAASPGAESALVQPTASPRRAKQTLSVTAKANQALVAVAIEGAQTTEYWVRCLPHDFPQLQMTLHPAAGTPPPGFYLIGNYLTENAGGYAMVLDGNGVPVWYHRNGSSVGVCNVDNVVNGAISYIPALGHSDEIHQLSPLTTKTLSTPHLDEHELRHLSNGDYLVITHPEVSGVDMTGLALTLPDGGTEPLGLNTNVLGCTIVEIDSSGTVMWSWDAAQHLDPAKDIGYVASVAGTDGGVIIDAFHCNSIDVEPKTENLLVSACHMNTVFYVEKLTGKILWKMGGAAYTKDDAVYVPVDQPFVGQHDARFQPDWSRTCDGFGGGISVFDDQFLQPGPARGIVYDVHVGSGDGGAVADCGVATDGGPSAATAAWQYKAPVSSQYMGSFRISPDGSRVIGWGTGGAPHLVFSEVDVGGHDLLDFYFEDENVSYRAIKVPLTAFDLEVLRTTAGHP